MSIVDCMQVKPYSGIIGVVNGHYDYGRWVKGIGYVSGLGSDAEVMGR